MIALIALIALWRLYMLFGLPYKYVLQKPTAESQKPKFCTSSLLKHIHVDISDFEHCPSNECFTRTQTGRTN